MQHTMMPEATMMHESGGDMGMGMMMPEHSTMILGFPLPVFLMYAAAAFYFICAFVLWKPYRQERNELMGALLAFLTYQAFAMLFMGIAIQSGNMTYDILASFSVLVGSVFMLKFPYSMLTEKFRRILFYLTMILVLVIFGWFLLTPERQEKLMNFTIWYDVLVNGVLVGFFIFLFGIRTNERSVKVKALGGSVGVASCCVAGNVAMIMGSLIVSSVFQFMAPVIIILSIITGRTLERIA